MHRLAILAALAALVAVALTPGAAASNCVADTPTSCNGVGQALVDGFAYITAQIFKGITQVFGGIILGFIDLVVSPFLGIFGGFFGGAATGLRSAALGLFNGAGGAMDNAYRTLTANLDWAGPFAPIMAAFVVLTVIVMAILVIGFLFKLALKNTEREVKDTVEGAEDE